MKSVDSRKLPVSTSHSTDICIVGAGVAGISIALQFARTSRSVCLIESGAYGPDQEVQSLYDLSNIGYPTRDNAMSRVRFFGGTSNIWAGRSMKLDPADLRARDWVPNSGWPIGYAELDRYYDDAERILELPSFTAFADRLARTSRFAATERALFCDGDLQPKAVVWGRQPLRFGKTFKRQLRQSPNIKIYINANVTEIVTNEAGERVEGITAKTLNGNQLHVTAHTYILACGGLENARLLLASRRHDPRGVGNRHDLVGRYFMDHPRVVLGSVRLSAPLGSSLLLGAPLPDGKLQIGIGLSEEAQRRERLLNNYLTLEPQLSEFAKQSYQSSANVAKVLMRRGYAGSRLDLFRADLPEIRDLVYVLTPKEVMPHFLYRHYARLKALTQRLRKVRDLTIINYCEQVPRPESRVFLGSSRDRLDMNALVVDWRIGPEETGSLVRLQELLGERLAREGIGRLDTSALETAAPSYTDASHHMGTTRMSDDPRRGVVNRDGKVHGVANLFIAGSSVFPTVGHANPTLTIVALAIRLADHLKQSHG
jgi:choline dehydrogenase-like flavoprotein